MQVCGEKNRQPLTAADSHPDESLRKGLRGNDRAQWPESSDTLCRPV